MFTKIYTILQWEVLVISIEAWFICKREIKRPHSFGMRPLKYSTSSGFFF